MKLILQWLTLLGVVAIVACGGNDSDETDASAPGDDAGNGGDAIMLPDATNGPNDAPFADATETSRRIFLTSSAQTADLGGLAGGDAICQSLASAAGLGGSWVAWLSDNDVDARDRIEWNGPWVVVDDDGIRHMVAADRDDLLDGVLDTPIEYDENGVQRTMSVWTGTEEDGTLLGQSDQCNGWTYGGAGPDNAVAGFSIATDYNWTKDGLVDCQGLRSLYCFER